MYISDKNESRELLTCAHAYFRTTVCQRASVVEIYTFYNYFNQSQNNFKFQYVRNFDWLKQLQKVENSKTVRLQGKNLQNATNRFFPKVDQSRFFCIIIKSRPALNISVNANNSGLVTRDIFKTGMYNVHTSSLTSA